MHTEVCSCCGIAVAFTHTFHSTRSEKAKGVERSVGTMRCHNFCSEMRSLWCIASLFCLLKITGAAPTDPVGANIDNAPQKYTSPDYPAGGFNIITQPRNTIVQNNYQGSMENGYPTDNYQDPHRFALLHSQEADLDIRRGNGQVRSRVVPPPEPPVPPKFKPQDYSPILFTAARALLSIFPVSGTNPKEDALF